MAKKTPPLDKGDKQSSSSRLQTQTVKKRSLQSNVDLIAEFDALRAHVAELETSLAQAIKAEHVAREQSEILRAASLALTESLDLEKIFETLLDYLALLIPYDSATIFLIEEDGQLVARAVRGYERYTDNSLAQMVRIERNSIPRIDHLVDEQISHIISDTTQDSTWIWVPATMHIRNWLAVPLVANGRTIGLYSLDKTEPNFFTDEHRHLAEALASQAALAIEKSQLFDREAATRARTETQSRRLNALNLVAQAVSSTRDLNEILEIAAREITTQLNARSCGVALINSTRTHLEVVAFAGQEGESSTVGIVIPLEGNLGTQQVISTRRPLVIADAQNSPLQNEGTREIFKERGATCILITPLIARDEVIGTFGTDMSDTHSVFTAEEVELAVTIASQISSAIENARLFDETQRRTQEIATMAEIGREISATLDLSTVLERIAARAMDVLHARDVVLRLLEPDGRLPAAVAIGKYAEIYKNWHAQLGQGLSGSVAQSGMAEIINDPENDPRVIDIAGTEQDKASRAILFAPLMIGETVIGVLSVWRDKIDAGAFTQADLDFTVSLARQAAIAIQNARLFTESQQRFKETEILRAANVALTKSFDLDSILSTLLDYLQQIVPYDTGSVFLLESETHLTARAARGYEQWTEIPAQAIRISFEFKTLPHIRAVVEDQATVIIPDVTQDLHWIETPTGKHVRNWLAVPLIASGKTIGMYSLDKAEAGFFTPEHQRLAENLAAQAAIAIQNAALFRNQQVAREQAETLQAVTQALSRTLGLQEVFDLILTELEKVVPYDSCSVQQLDDDGSVIVGGRGFPNLEELIGLRFPNTAGDLNSYVISTRQPYIVDDIVVRFPHFKNREHGAGRIHGWLGVPLIFGDRLIGMLALDKHEKSFYTPEHAQLAKAFAAQAAVAIENARLFETERAAREQAEVQTRQMAALNRVAQAVTSTLDLQAVLEIAAREMTILINARSAGVGLLNESKSELRVAAYYSQADEPSAVGLIIPVEGNLATEQVIETGQSILIPDAQHTPLQSEATRAVMRARNTHCILLLPLLARGEVIGTIGPDTDQPDRVFTPEEVQLAQTITNQLAGVIENARLFDETQQRNAELAILNNIGEVMAQTLDVKTLTRNVGDKVREIFKAEIADILLYDQKTNMVHLVYSYSAGYFDDEPPWELGEGGLTTQIILSGQSLLVNSAEEMEEQGAVAYVTTPESEPDPQSYLGVPIMVGDRVLGVVDVQSMRANAFDENSLRLLQTLSSNMGVALENARLFDETQHLLNETEKRNIELAVISNVSQALVVETEVESMIQLIGGQLREIFDADIVYVALLDPQTNLIHLPYQVGLSFDTLKLGEGLTSRILLTGEPLLLNKDVMEHARALGVQKVGRDALSYLAVPIKAGGENIGVISVQSTTQEGLFTEDSLRLLTTIASNAGAAIQTARLHSETKRLFQEAQEARAAAEQANRAKSTFLANMSHELRTPLNAIMGFTSLVREKSEGVLPEKQIGNLDKVLSSSQHLLGLINTVLDLAKIEAGRMDVIPAKFNMSSLADQCANLAAPLLKPNVTLEKQVDDTIGIIFSDQDKIKQIVLNLLSNAAKFTHEGRILLSVQKLKDEMLNISVTDSGIGISEEALGRIFEEFQQADTSTTRQYGGTGLGLAISRNLARLLGGDLVATSELGKGSTFTLTIAIYYGRKPDSQSDQEISVQGTAQPSKNGVAKHRVLVIDDDPDAIYLLQEGLGTSEFEVIGARTGQVGLQIARDQQPEAILLDVLMPETDGWQILNDLKSDIATINIPVILLTIVDKKALGFKLGATDYLLKPLNPIVVLDALRRVVAEKSQAHKCVIVVDDDPNVAEMLRQILPESEFELNSAEDGEAGLQAIKAHHPDVILLDLMMPRLDGFGVIEKLRADPELRNIPIIVISAKELSKDEARKLRESVAFVMKKQGIDGIRLIQEISSVVKK